MNRLILCLFLLPLLLSGSLRYASASIDNPILFVTQVPDGRDFVTVVSTFGSHQGTVRAAPRGGDLWIRYADGTLKNLTAAAGYGVDGHQDANGIAVRDPAVHWDGDKAIFSMVVGAPERWQQTAFYWQLYEISGLGIADTPTITKVANQPADFNNINPVYGSDDSVIFTSDRPRNGERHLYPQLDEYEESPTVSGLWKLVPTTGELTLLDHSPSGDFDPFVDSFGRIIFTRWDHLQRDQQADADSAAEAAGGSCIYCTFDWSDESAEATQLTTRTENFPEPHTGTTDDRTNNHRFNHFFPWMLHQDGTEHETLNHIGRHELHRYFNRSFDNDSALNEFISVVSGRTNPNDIENFFQIIEDPQTPGRYIGIDAPEFETHASGQIVAFDAAPTDNPDAIVVDYLTHPDTGNVSETPSADHSGLYRNPLMTNGGTLIATHTAETRGDRDDNGGDMVLQSRYDFRIKSLQQSGDYYVPDQLLTSGISETISFYSPDVLVTYSGYLWELQPVEVVAVTRPPLTQHGALPSAEQAVFDAAGVSVESFQAYLRSQDLALIVSRDVTTRDNADIQQPFNLRVPDGVQSSSGDGQLYDVQYMQLFEALQLRSLTFGGSSTVPGRRVLPRELTIDNPPSDGALGSVTIAADGSVAAFVPASRALSWQLNSPTNEPVVRERYWLTFQAGEVRVCASCHGINDVGQTGAAEPINEPEALAELLGYWQTDVCTQTPTPVGCTTPTAVELTTQAGQSADVLGILVVALLLSIASLGVMRR